MILVGVIMPSLNPATAISGLKVEPGAVLLLGCFVVQRGGLIGIQFCPVCGIHLVCQAVVVIARIGNTG